MTTQIDTQALSAEIERVLAMEANSLQAPDRRVTIIRQQGEVIRKMREALEYSTGSYADIGKSATDAWNEMNARFEKETGEIAPDSDPDFNYDDFESADWRRREAIWAKWHKDKQADALAILHLTAPLVKEEK